MLSIVTPSFNHADYISDTIASVQAQSPAKLEHLIIDGGSTDGSLARIRQHSNRLTFWVSEPDAGQAAAINKGMRRARGELLAWLNSDDTYRPGAVAAAARFLADNPQIDVVYGDVDFVNEASQVIGTMRAWEFDKKLQICGTNLVPQPACFFRRSVFERVSGLDESLHYALDYDLWVRMAIAGAHFAHVPEVWATYRLHPSSKTETHAERFAVEVRRVLERAFVSGGAPPAWRTIADSNLEQLIAETHLRLGQRQEARRHFWRAVRRYPWRPKSLGLLAFAVDMRLGLVLRRWRWRLAGRHADSWQPLLRLQR